MGSIHLINAQRSVTSCITTSLFPHSVCHKESLIWFLSTKPIIKRYYYIILLFKNLHSVYSLSRWLALSASDVLLVVLVDESISERTVCHSMFVHIVVLEIRHHISKSSLSSRFCSLFLYFVHLLQVLFRSWVQLWSKPFLSLKRPSFWFGYLVDLEATTHGWVHHDLTRCLNLLETVQGNIIKITGTVEISLLVSHHLLEETISSSFSLFLLE